MGDGQQCKPNWYQVIGLDRGFYANDWLGVIQGFDGKRSA
jgi:hypothetical protein